MFYFFLPKVGQLWISHAFSEKKGVKQKRSVILEKNIWRLSNDLAQSFTRSKTGQDFNHHQAMISATSYLAKQLYIHQDYEIPKNYLKFLPFKVYFKLATQNERLIVALENYKKSASKPCLLKPFLTEFLEFFNYIFQL